MLAFSHTQEAWFEKAIAYVRARAGEPRALFPTLLIATALSVPATGYVAFDSDQLLYLPSVIHTLHPEVYNANDLLLSFDQGIWAPVYSTLLTALLSSSHVYGLMFLVWFALRFLTFYTLYRLLLYFSKNTLISLLGVFVFLTGAGLLENELVPRTLALPLDLFALAVFFEGRKTFGAVLIGLSFFVHPLTAVIFCFVLLAHFEWRIVIPGALALALLLMHPLSHQPFFIDPAWQAILADRATSLYFTKWLGFNSTAYASVLLTLLAWPFLRTTFSGPERKTFDLLYATPFLCLLISLITVDALNIHFVAQLQILRSFELWQLVTPIALVVYLAKHPLISRYELYLLAGAILALTTKETAVFAFLPALVVLHAPVPMRRAASMACHVVSATGLIALSVLHIKSESGIIAALIAIATTAFLLAWRQWALLAAEGLALAVYLLTSIHASFYLPSWSLRPDFADACAWIQANTAPDAMFVVTDTTLASSPPLRVLCHRSVYVQKKDGALGIFNRDFAIAWEERLSNVAAHEYEAGDYVLARRTDPESGRLIFQNKTYSIYRVSKNNYGNF